MGAADIRQSTRDLEQRFGFQLSPRELAALPPFLALLEKWNHKINLTGRADAVLVLGDHIFEALWAARHFVSSGSSIADIGSGAGFPGLFLALATGARTVLIESQHKRAGFLREATRAMALSARVYEGRAEEYPDWNSIEIASVRALRLSPDLLAPLHHNRVDLLWFHTLETPAPAQYWRECRTLTVPGSRQRRVTLLQPV